MFVQRVAIKKQFFLAGLHIQHPGSQTQASNQTSGALSNDTVSNSSSSQNFSRLLVRLAAPNTGATAVNLEAGPPGSNDTFEDDKQQTEYHAATDENLKVFFELKSSVPLQFSTAHTVNFTSSGTHTLQVCPNHAAAKRKNIWTHTFGKL